MENYSAMRRKEILPLATIWMQLEGIMLKLKIELPYAPAIPHLGKYLKKKNLFEKYMHPNVPSRIINSCHDMEATPQCPWMTMECIMLIEISQTQRKTNPKYCMVSLIYGL